METRAVRGEYMAAFTPYGYVKNMEYFQKMGFKCASNRQKEKKLWTGKRSAINRVK